MDKKLKGGTLEKIIFIVVIFLLFLITIFTHYNGSIDVNDYASVAKFFAGEYNAKIRSSHSYSYGFLCSPFVKLTSNFIGIKVMSLLWLILIIISLYYLSGKKRKMLLLIVTSPIFWYMAPWINSIQISSLLFLWGYYFIKKYNEDNKISNLIYSGLFIGFSLVFWNTVIYFSIILSLCFLWNKKLFHCFLFLVSFIVGLLPLFIIDLALFNFPLYSTAKWIIGTILNILGLTAGGGAETKSFLNIFSVLIILPLFSYLLLKLKNFKENKKTTIFLVLSLLLILINPQIRYTLILIPIILLNINQILTDRQFKIQIIFSLFLILLVIFPYIMQMKYTTNAQELTSLLGNIDKLEFSKENIYETINQDLKSISKDFSNQTFIVGNNPDDYSILANIYWGREIKEFVSIQDYRLYIENKTIIFEKEFHPIPNINDRREIWIKGGISRKTNDFINYTSIKFAISNETEIDLKGFELKKSYQVLKVFEKKNTSM